MPAILSVSNPSQLAEFCAMIVPCIWAGSLKSNQQPLLSPKRHATFKIFVQKILKATQISCACIILALYYVQRLRSEYPSIRASSGSEVRLFTTALVLANKYLDDNTFTNKTWSDVSGIPVTELNIMEMEFLSALNYNIHIPHTQFFQWTTQCQQLWIPFVQRTSTSMPIKRSASHDNEDQSPKKRLTSSQHDLLHYYQPTICRPILSWSSSTSDNNYLNDVYAYNYNTVANVAAAAVNANYSTNYLASRVQCLEIE
ncbi:cyclin-domain-containing protein [Pilobolus umbonatus]|nr:cyclin-domain-containing protein [Pilobolus umbonatus]